MAEPTMAEKVAAARAALLEIGVDDPDEALRSVMAFWSQAPMLPAAKPSETPETLVVTSLSSADPAMQERIKALGDEANAIMKELMTAEPATSDQD